MIYMLVISDEMNYIIEKRLQMIHYNFCMIIWIIGFIWETECACTAPTPYEYNSNCYAECPWNPPDVTYLQGSTCVTSCSSGYADDSTKECVSDCPTDPILTFKDTNRNRCVEVCSSNPSQFAHISNTTCVEYCPSNTWADKSTRTCVDTCPSGSYYQVSGSERLCVQRCYPGYYADLDSLCVVATSCPSTPVQYYGDDSTNLCVEECPPDQDTYAEESSKLCVHFCSLGTFADPETLKCVDECSIGPPTYYGSNTSRTCHLQCLEGQFADPSLRECTPACTGNTFGDYSTRTCVDTCPEADSTFADPLTDLCIEVCSPGYYADNFTRSCVLSTNCDGQLVGDPLTLQCVKAQNCPIGYFVDTVDKMCVRTCEDPYWANLVTRYCMLYCDWNPPVYVSWKESSTRQCVEECPKSPMTFGSNATQQCVSACPDGTFADVLSYTCVETCPDNFHSEATNNLCVSDCTTTDDEILYFYTPNTTCVDACPQEYFADDKTMSCVETCPDNTYGYQDNNTCLSGCPDGLYADDHSHMCVSYCPDVTAYYADDSTNKCVKVCPIDPDYFGEFVNDGHRKCVDECSKSSHFADPITRTCVEECNLEEGYFGYPTDGRCWLTCPTGYGNPFTVQCVDDCPESPIQTYADNLTSTCVEGCPNSTYADPSTQKCVHAEDCPAGTFGDDLTNSCVDECSVLDNLFGDPQTKKCVSVCGDGYYADHSSRECVVTCNATTQMYKDPSTKTCVHVCPQMPDLYADDSLNACVDLCSNDFYAVEYNTSTIQTRKCMEMCPSTPALYADEQTKKCVSQCANLTYKFVNNTYRGCLDYCPQQVFDDDHAIDLFEDNTTWTCVSVCPIEYFAFKHPTNTTRRQCVRMCEIVDGTNYFAENISRSCVTECPMKDYSTYGDTIVFACVQNCSIFQYRDNATKKCTYSCTEGTFADNSTWNCVEDCPQGTFAEDINNTCVKYCPTNYFGYNSTCVPTCDHLKFFADNTSWMCVEACPSQPDYYQNNDECVLECAESHLYADPVQRKCLPALQCGTGLVADPFSHRCISRCPSHPMYFHMASTNLCGPECFDSLFADNTTNQCVDQCPSPYYGVNSTTYYVCVQYCPANQFMYDQERMCVSACPDGYFADSLTMSCVIECPDNYYGFQGDNTCITDCQPLYRDDSNKQCVQLCNGTTASNSSFKCQDQCDYGEFAHEQFCIPECPDDFFADNLTRKCILECPDDPFTYADSTTHKCVFVCPSTYYAYDGNQTCLDDCPDGLFKQGTLRRCVEVCLEGQIADPSSMSCQTDCLDPDYTFYDPTNQSCVEMCPEDPDLYGYNDDTCLTQCPLGYYAQNFTRTCVQVCPNVSLVILNESWADDLTRRCLEQCSALTFSFSNSTDNICLQDCPDGWFASDVLKACVDVCPNGTYAHNDSKQCVQKCPNGQYGDTHLHICVDQCTYNDSQYRDNSTNMCVEECPSIPNMFAQESTKECVLSCQINFFAYLDNRTCLPDCPDPYYADTSTGSCVEECPIHEQTFADDVLRSCEAGCVNHTIDGTEVMFYADPSTSRCVEVCPQTPQKLYALNESNSCEVTCPSGTFGDNDTRLCLQSCIFEDPKFTWADSLDNFCVETCPLGYYADNTTVSCVDQCPQSYFADNSTGRCVVGCPVSPALYGYTDDRTCVFFCPDGLFADESIRKCVTDCPTSPFMSYHYTPTNKCVRECLYPYFAEEKSQDCVQTCQDGYYGNLTTHKCQLCKTQCVTCSAYLQCSSCAAGFYLYEIECVTSCPSYPVMYFAHQQSNKCFEKCPAPYFGQTNTGLCQLACPVLYYAHTTTRICTKCATGCLTCDVDGCYSCQQNYTFVLSSLSCSSYCNTTHIYRYDDDCYDQCPEGTYLNVVDMVSCNKCNEECAACSNIGSNCTKCAFKFYYLGECVNRCPVDFYVDDDMACQACASKPSKCELDPLNYTIHPFTKSYKLHAYVVFNREVSLTIAEFKQKVQITNNNQPVHSSEFTCQLFNATTYWLTFKSSASLNQNSLNIGFDPGSITDMFGNHLTINEVEEEYDAEIGVNEEIDEATEKIAEGTNIVGWIFLAVVLLFMIKGGYPLLIAIQVLQMYYMYIFVLLEPRPYVELKFLEALKYLHFLFLPILFPEIKGYENQSYEVFLENTSLLYNSSPFILLLSFALFLSILFFTIKKCSSNKAIRHGARRVIKYRLRYMIFNDVLWFTYFYAFFFAVYQFRQVAFQTTWDIVNLVMACIVAILYVSYTVLMIYLGNKYKEKKIPRKWSFLAMEPAAFPMELPLRYLRKLLICVALLIPHADTQCLLLIVFNLIFFLYLLCFMPAKSTLTNVINIIIQASYVILAAMYYGYHRLVNKTLDEQLGFGIGMVSLQGLVLLIIGGWLVYRFFKMIGETVTWKNVYNRITENKDPEYLREQQKKRDLEFDLGSLENRSQEEQTEHFDSSSRDMKNEKKFNIFELREKDDESISYQQDKESKGSNFAPSRTQEIKKKNLALEIRQNTEEHELQEIVFNQQSPKESKKINNIWDDLEFDENEI